MVTYIQSVKCDQCGKLRIEDDTPGWHMLITLPPQIHDQQITPSRHFCKPVCLYTWVRGNDIPRTDPLPFGDEVERFKERHADAAS